MPEAVRRYGIWVEGLDFDTKLSVTEEMQSLGTECSYHEIDLMAESRW